MTAARAKRHVYVANLHESASDNAARPSKQAWSNTAPQLVDERDYNSFFVVRKVLAKIIASTFQSGSVLHVRLSFESRNLLVSIFIVLSS